jgi:hypothetical protein
VYLFDEVDASLPGATLAFNAALANGHCDFPGASEPVKKHKDCYLIAAANTWGLGGTSDYVGRNKLDAAFLDRFVKISWTYDEELELALATRPEWCKRIQRIRANVKRQGLKIVVSPRATIHGCALLDAGFSEDDALDATIRAGISAEDWSRINA